MSDVDSDIGGVLLPYQQRWVADKSQIKIAEKSRRVGLTWGEAADNAITAASSKNAGGDNVYYIGSNKDMATEYIEACGMWAKSFNKAASEVEEEIFQDEDGNKEILTFIVRFPKSGFKITALSSRPSNLRGMQGDVVIDEAAFHDHLDELLKAAMALTMWGSRVRIISTHNGVDNLFNTYIQDSRAGKNDYSVHRITLDQALNDGLFKRICLVTKTQWTQSAQDDWRKKLIDRSPTKDMADEEYFCTPRQGGGSYLSRALIESRTIIQDSFKH